ncbi:MAG: hypothetical protein J6A59_11675 [Lachnospiraceae bacterium]|nr:hypothetical protein [Lachnospiraceae bacterium]
MVIDKINKLSIHIKSYYGLICPTYVTIKKSRKCSLCGKEHPCGTRMVTASDMVDKKYNITYKEAYDNKDRGAYRFVKVRHWMCIDCFEKLTSDINKSMPKRKINRRIPFDEINLDDYDEDTQLLIIEDAYNNGELTSEEYRDLENAIIDSIAFRDAMGIGQE